jgi:hypothetical protein
MNQRVNGEKKRALGMLDGNRPLSIESFQERPELLFVPLTGVCFLLSLAPFAYGLQWGQLFVYYLVTPTANQISPVTWTAAWTTFGLTLVLMVRWTRLSILRCAMVAVSVPFGATGVFEIIFQAIGVSVRGFHWGPFDWFAISLWTAIGITGLPFWRLTKMFWFWLAGTIGGFGAWALVGYPQVGWGVGESVLVAYTFNIALKVMVFFLFATPMVNGIQHFVGKQTTKRRS